MLANIKNTFRFSKLSSKIIFSFFQIIGIICLILFQIPLSDVQAQVDAGNNAMDGKRDLAAETGIFTDCASVTEIPQGECEALTALFTSTSGSGWTNNAGWLSTDTPCSWFGVGCIEGHIDSIVLSNNNLSGPLPPELGNLANLATLNLWSNHLTGNIPAEMGNLVNLLELDLGNNQLSGNIPPELGNLTHLKTLFLIENQLSGSIPPEFGNLSNLSTLDFLGNQLSGSIPQQMGNMTNLTRLDLEDNQLSGLIPPELGNLTNLSSLWLAGNQLTGSIPAEIGNLTKLTQLLLQSNQLSGEIPSATGNLTQLIRLNISKNEFSGSLPLELTNLTRLSEINFVDTKLCMPLDEAFQTWINAIPEKYVTTNCPMGSFTSCGAVTGINESECTALTALYNSTDGPNWTHQTNWLSTDAPCLWYGVDCVNGNVSSLILAENNLSGPFPTELSYLSGANKILLDHNHLTGNLPPEIENLTHLKTLDLSENELSGEIPGNIGFLPLVSLNLHSNKLGGSVPETLFNISNLRILDIGDNQLEGKDLYYVDFPSRLEYLDLSENNFQGKLPSGLWYLTYLKEAYLYGNSFSGTIPNEISNLTGLEKLYLNSNLLTGGIPVEISALSNLTELNLSNNQLEGSIPGEIGIMSGLKILGLGANILNGFIPAELGNLIQLEVLGLGYNHLNGSIPPEIGNLTELTVLSLFDNELTGQVPEEFGNLTKLKELYIDSNPLEGMLPMELTNLANLERFYFADTGLCMPTQTAFQNWLAAIPYKAVTENCIMVTSITGISPRFSFTSGPAFILTVKGADFRSGSMIQWGDTALTTTFINSSELTAQVPAENLINPGQVAVTVYTPGMPITVSESKYHTVSSCSPAYNQKLATSKVTFDWDDIADANLYNIQLSLNKSFSSYILNTNTISSSFAFGTPLTNGRTYYWRIRARFGSTWEPWSSILQFISMTPPTSPVLISPANSFLTNDNTVDLYWNLVTNGARYQVQISKSSTFAPMLVNLVLEEGITSYSTDALPDGLYYWRVRGIDEVNVNGAWSGVRSFRVDTIAPAVPKMYSPGNNASTPDTTPALTVTAVSGSKYYRFQLAAADDFSDIKFEKTSLGTTATVPAAQALAYHDRYYWRVKAIDAAGNESDWSAVRGLTVTFQKTPAEAAFTTDTTPLFTWFAVGGAKTYELAVMSEAGGDSYSVPLGLVTSHTVPAAKALAVGKYTWVLKAKIGENWAASPARHLTITPPLLKAPGLVNPANGFATQDPTPTLEWSMVTDGNPVRYELWLDNSTAFGSREYESIFTGDVTQITLSSELPDGRYYWKMRTINYLDVPGPWGAYRSLLVDNVPPNAPKLYTPANNATVRGTPKFTWYAVSGAKYYQFQTTSITEPPVVVQSADNLSVTYYKPGLLEPGKYTWQARARDAAGNWSGWSAVRTITIRPMVPAAPVLISPVNGATVTISTPEFRWNPVPYGDTYQIQISTSSTFATTIENKSLERGVLSFTPENPLSNRTYYWRVRAKNSLSEYGVWSAVRSFKVSQ